MHVFQTDKIIEAQIGVSLVAAPVFCPEAMHRRRLVPLGLEVVGQCEHGFGHMLLVGLGTAGQEGHRIAGEGFKLHIAGAAAETGAVRPAIGAGLLQGVEVLGNIRVKGDTVLFQLGDIPVGLVHHIDDGWILLLLVFGRGGGVAGGIQRACGELLALVHIFQQVIHSFFRVVVGFIDLQIGQVGHKAGDNTIVAVIAVLHPCVRHNAHGLRNGRLQVHAEDEQAQRRSRGGAARQSGQPTLFVTAAEQKKAAHRQCQHHDDGDDHAGLDLEARSGRHAGSFRHLCQIPRQKGLAAQLQGVEVHGAGRAGQHRHTQRGQWREPEHPVQQQPHQKQHQPCQKVGRCVGEDETCKDVCAQTPAGDPLAQQQHDQRCRRGEEHPQSQKRFWSFHGSDSFPYLKPVFYVLCTFCTILLRLL